MKNNGINKILAIIAAALGLVVIMLTVGLFFLIHTKKASSEAGEGDKAQTESVSDESDDAALEDDKEDTAKSRTEENKDTDSGDAATVSYARDALTIDFTSAKYEDTPSVDSYQATDYDDVVNNQRFYLQDHVEEKLLKNNFVVTDNSYNEFFDIYENNRYRMRANFISADSMMHTYHLFFAMLQKATEKDYLIDECKKLSERMLENSKDQYDKLKGTEWEDAAILNVEFFGVGSELINKDADIPKYASKAVKEELEKINSASAIEESALMDEKEDYSQYKPRGYYEGDEELEDYFRTMMWYGRRNFAQDQETSNRSALLMTLALDDKAKESWDRIYQVTAFFAGSSDDSGYYEYMPLIEEAYKKGADTEDLIGDDEGWKKFDQLTAELDPPKINSVVTTDNEDGASKTEEAKGYRFMGQRFTLDGEIFTNLCYSNVKENNNNEKRMLPDALDVPAAMGSDTALTILDENGDTEYEGYKENMLKLREEISSAGDETWNSSLYGGWLKTLEPLLEKKGDGYPSFMTSEEWAKKDLETYLGSWTELKHDTILYSKQFMAEMGGDDDEVIDDRGYVEPEPEVYLRLAALTEDTRSGLEELQVISKDNGEYLSDLADLSRDLADISVKELNNETLSDEEYELIRTYGGNLEHFWEKAIEGNDTSVGDDGTSKMYPAALVADVATDPNGSVLEEAIGGISEIYVIFPLEGKLHVASGGVFTYYQFTVPISERMTDSKWRQMLGLEIGEDMEYPQRQDVDQPSWTDSYRTKAIYSMN